MLLSRCEHPLIVTDRRGVERSVPCGRCIACQSIKKYQWKKRLDNEFLYHRYGLAFTLTYDDLNLSYCLINVISGDYHYSKYDFPLENKPLTKDIVDDCKNYFTVCSDGFYHVPVFCRSDLRQFIQKIKNYAPKIRYYIQTEYGPTTLRPHAHGVLFFSEYEVEFIRSLILQAWPFCDWDISTNYESIHLVENASYCTSYLTPSVVLPKIYQFGRFKPFSVKSTGVPIGSLVFNKTDIADYQYQEKESIVHYSPRVGDYEFLPFFRFHQNTFFPRLPFNDELSPRARKLLFESYGYYKALVVKEGFAGKFTFDVYKHVFARNMSVLGEIGSEILEIMQSESTLYRVYLCSKKFFEKWKSVPPLLRDYAFDRFTYRFEMQRLFEQYSYEEEWCNKRHLDPRYLIYKDYIFVKECMNDFSPSPNMVQKVLNYGYTSWDDFTASSWKFSVNVNPDVKSYLSRIREYSRLNHKSHAKNGYFESKEHVKPFYLKKGL